MVLGLCREAERLLIIFGILLGSFFGFTERTYAACGRHSTSWECFFSNQESQKLDVADLCRKSDWLYERDLKTGSFDSFCGKQDLFDRIDRVLDWGSDETCFSDGEGANFALGSPRSAVCFGYTEDHGGQGCGALAERGRSQIRYFRGKFGLRLSNRHAENQVIQEFGDWLEASCFCKTGEPFPDISQYLTMPPSSPLRVFATSCHLRGVRKQRQERAARVAAQAACQREAAFEDLRASLSVLDKRIREMLKSRSRISIPVLKELRIRASGLPPLANTWSSFDVPGYQNGHKAPFFDQIAKHRQSPLGDKEFELDQSYNLVVVLKRKVLLKKCRSVGIGNVKGVDYLKCVERRGKVSTFPPSSVRYWRKNEDSL